MAKRRKNEMANEITEVHFAASHVSGGFEAAGMDNFNIAAGLAQLAAHHFMHYGGSRKLWLALADNSFDIADDIHRKHCLGEGDDHVWH